MIDDTRYPPRPAGPLRRCPRPTIAAEAARLRLIEAPAADPSPTKTKMLPSRRPGPMALSDASSRPPAPLRVKTRGGPRSCGGLLGVGGAGGIERCRCCGATAARWFPSSSAGDGHYPGSGRFSTVSDELGLLVLVVVIICKPTRAFPLTLLISVGGFMVRLSGSRTLPSDSWNSSNSTNRCPDPEDVVVVVTNQATALFLLHFGCRWWCWHRRRSRASARLPSQNRQTID